MKKLLSVWLLSLLIFAYCVPIVLIGVLIALLSKYISLWFLLTLIVYLPSVLIYSVAVASNEKVHKTIDCLLKLL